MARRSSGLMMLPGSMAGPRLMFLWEVRVVRCAEDFRGRSCALMEEVLLWAPDAGLFFAAGASFSKGRSGDGPSSPADGRFAPWDLAAGLSAEAADAALTAGLPAGAADAVFAAGREALAGRSSSSELPPLPETIFA